MVVPTAKYDYTLLNAVYEGLQHIYGIVVEFKTKELTNSHVLELQLTDDSFPEDSERKLIFCQIYANSVAKLPKIGAKGDIIRVHRIRCKTFDNFMELKGLVGSGGLHCCIWGKNTAIDAPKKTSNNATLEETDFERVRELREYLETIRNTDLFKKPVPFHKFSDFAPRAYRNVVARIVACIEPKTDEHIECYVLRVTDGTKIMHQNRPLDLAKIDLATEACVRHSVDNEVMQAIPEYCYDIFVYDDHKDVAKQLKAGDYAIFYNCHVYWKRTTNINTLTIHGGGHEIGRKIAKINGSDPKKMKFHLELFKNRPSRIRPPVSPNVTQVVWIKNRRLETLLGAEVRDNDSDNDDNAQNTNDTPSGEGEADAFETPIGTPEFMRQLNVSRIVDSDSSDDDVQYSQPAFKKRKTAAEVQRVEHSVQTTSPDRRAGTSHRQFTDRIDSPRRKLRSSPKAADLAQDQPSTSGTSGRYVRPPINRRSVNVGDRTRSSENNDISTSGDSVTDQNGHTNLVLPEVFVVLERLEIDNERSRKIDNSDVPTYSKEVVDRLFPKMKQGTVFKMQRLKAASLVPEACDSLFYLLCPVCKRKTNFQKYMGQNNNEFECSNPKCTKDAPMVLEMLQYAMVPYADDSDEYLMVFDNEILEKILEKHVGAVVDMVVKHKFHVLPGLRRLIDCYWDCTIQVCSDLKLKALKVIEIEFQDHVDFSAEL